MAFKAHFLNVGCADCTIFELESDIVLIDCGYRRFSNGVSRPTSIYSYLKNIVRKAYIDLLIISHPHHDHYLGIEELIGRVTVTEFWGSPYERRYGDNSLSSDEWEEYKHLRAKLKPQKSFVCTKGASKIFSGCYFQVLGPAGGINLDKTRECHDGCLVIWVETPANKFLVCGDASDSELYQVCVDWQLSSCDVLRASHHGSMNGANLEFVKAASARDTVISTQSGVFENLPDSAALKRYRDHSENIFRTDINGTCVAPLLI